MGNRARQVFDQKAGATACCLKVLRTLLQPAAERSA